MTSFIWYFRPGKTNPWLKNIRAMADWEDGLTSKGPRRIFCVMLMYYNMNRVLVYTIVYFQDSDICT